MSEIPNAAAGRRKHRQPAGLAIVSAMEACVSFSLYGTQSLLGLYLAHHLLQPPVAAHVLGLGAARAAVEALYGPLVGQAFASALLGMYFACVFATPILGGLLADCLLGRSRTILLGGVIAMLGDVLLAADATGLLALPCLLIGLGCLGNLKAQTGALYQADDPRRAEGYQIFMLAVSAAVILAPLVCGGLGERVGWRWGFLAAAAGQGAGLLTYLAGRDLLPPDMPKTASRRARMGASAARTDVAEAGRVALLLLLLPVMALASVGNMEIYNGYLFWAQAHYALDVAGVAMPVSWLISLDAGFGVLTLLGSLAGWRWWRRNHPEPGEIGKMTLGAGLMAVAPLVLAAASALAGTRRIGLGWAVVFHLLNDAGFSNFYAVGLALYARMAPAGLRGTLVSAFALQLFLSNLLVGRLAASLSRLGSVRFWLLHAALAGLAAAALLACARLFRPSF